MPGLGVFQFQGLFFSVDLILSSHLISLVSLSFLENIVIASFPAGCLLLLHCGTSSIDILDILTLFCGLQPF